MKHLATILEQIKSFLNNRVICLFLDYDGTLSPIAPSPPKALLPTDAKKILEKLLKTNQCELAVISGRSVSNLKKLIGIRNVTYIGTHGFEIDGPAIRFRKRIPVKYQATLKNIERKLHNKLAPFNGVLIENKGISLSLHYRLVSRKNIPSVKKMFYDIAGPYVKKNKIKTGRGKMVLEIRPPVKWNKGAAVLWLLEKKYAGFRNMPLAPVYIGDDRTDEDAFKVL
ncbi:MAG: trehalose-phosphatase, partial [Candidatus Schekmanbacteria bacterium RBG_13_48_7]